MTTIRPRVMVIGSINVDLVARVRNLPERGETIHTTSFQRHVGGKGSNQAAAAALLGADVTMIGCVGDDEAGAHALQRLDALHVDCSKVRVVRGVPTGKALITVGGQGENTIVVVPGANQKLVSSDLEQLELDLASYSAVILQLEVKDEVVQAAVKAVRNLPVLCNEHETIRSGMTADRPWLVFNPSPFRSSALPPSGTIDLLVVNEVEAEAMSGLPAKEPVDAAKAAFQLRSELSPRGCVVITLGSRGCIALPVTSQKTANANAGGPNKALYIPGMFVDAIDTTGAGDVFTGGLVAQLRAGQPLAQALRFATAAAAITVTRPGAQSSFPSEQEVASVLTQVGEARSIGF